MKRLILVLLFFCFSMVMFADTGNSPPIEKQSIEFVINNDVDVVAFEMPVVNLIISEGVAISTGDMIMATKNILKSQTNSYYVINITLEKSSSLIYKDIEYRIRGTDTNYCGVL